MTDKDERIAELEAEDKRLIETENGCERIEL